MFWPLIISLCFFVSFLFLLIPWSSCHHKPHAFFIYTFQLNFCYVSRSDSSSLPSALVFIFFMFSCDLSSFFKRTPFLSFIQCDHPVLLLSFFVLPAQSLPISLFPFPNLTLACQYTSNLTLPFLFLFSLLQPSTYSPNQKGLTYTFSFPLSPPFTGPTVKYLCIHW